MCVYILEYSIYRLSLLQMYACIHTYTYPVFTIDLYVQYSCKHMYVYYYKVKTVYALNISYFDFYIFN